MKKFLVLALLVSVFLKPKCDNVHFYMLDSFKCLEYCADGDWSRVEFCKKRAEAEVKCANTWYYEPYEKISCREVCDGEAKAFCVKRAAWDCRTSNPYNGATKCSVSCFESDYQIGVIKTCKKVVY